MAGPQHRIKAPKAYWMYTNVDFILVVQGNKRFEIVDRLYKNENILAGKY